MGLSESSSSRWDLRSWRGGGVRGGLGALVQPERRGLEASQASGAFSFGVGESPLGTKGHAPERACRP